MDIVSIDGETRALANLTQVGVHRYVECPHFRIYMFAWAFNDEEPELWEYGQPFPKSLINHAKRRGMFHAWNAQFERVTMRNQFAGAVDIRRDQWVCTMVRALACGIPGKLENAAIALKVQQRKDMDGSKSMHKLMRPANFKELKNGSQTTPVWYERKTALQLYKTTGEYCKQDVRTEREAGKRLPRLPDSEQKQYVYDQLVADRGIRIDVELCKSAIKVSTIRKAELKHESMALCGVSTTQVAKVVAWARSKGVELENLKAPTVDKALKDPKLPPDVRAVLKLRQESGKTSVSKYQTALEYKCADGKIRGQRQFYGAHTGRWSGRGVQLDNLMRPTMHKSQLEDAVRLVRYGETWLVEAAFGSVMETVANATRSVLIADPGKDLYVADYKSIESRKLAHTSGQQSTLDSWRKADAGDKRFEVYVQNAANMFAISTEQVVQQNSQEWRFWGKTSELLLGYQGGTTPLLNGAEKSGAKFREIFPTLHKLASADTRDKVHWLWDKMGEGHEKDWKAARYVVENWRRNNYMTVRLWAELQKCSIEALSKENRGRNIEVWVKNPKTGQKYNSGISFCYDVKLKMLFCNLKSGRAVIYPHAELITGKNFKGEPTTELRAHYWNGKIRKYIRYNPYGGLIAENVTQAESRDVMAYNFQNVEAKKFQLLHTVHDEMITQATLGSSLKEFSEAAAGIPPWCKTMPVAVDAWHGPAYKKG